MNAVLKLSQLNGLISDIFDGIGNAFSNIVSAIFARLAMMLYQFIIVPLLLIMNAIQILFKKLAGLDTYAIDGQTRSGDIVLSLIENKTVQNIFWSLLILAVVLLFLTTIVALIRAETQIADEKPKSKSQIFSRAIKALVNFFMVPAVAILGVVMGNALLKSLDKATSSSNTSIGGIVFKACASECNRARTSPEFARDLVINDGYNDFGLFRGDNNADPEHVATKIDEAFVNNTVFDKNDSNDSDGSLKLDKLGSLFTDLDGPYTFQLPLAIFSVGTATIARSSFSIYDAEQVFYYYDLVDFNFLLAIIVSLFVTYVLFVTAIGLIKRFFKLTTLLVVSPVIASLYPIDEGKSLGEWRKSFIGSCLSAYSTVVVLNIMLALLGPLTKFEIFPNGATGVGGGFLGIATGTINNIASLLIICGGFAFFQELTGELAKIIGAENAYESGGKAAGKMAQVAGQVAGAAVGLGKGLKAGKLLGEQHKEVNELGEKNKEAQKEHGARIKELENKQLAGTITATEKDELGLRKEKLSEAKNKLKEAEGKEKDYQAEASQLFKSARMSFASAATAGVSDKFMKPINDMKDGKALAGAKFKKYNEKTAHKEAVIASEEAKSQIKQEAKQYKINEKSKYDNKLLASANLPESNRYEEMKNIEQKNVGMDQDSLEYKSNQRDLRALKNSFNGKAVKKVEKQEQAKADKVSAERYNNAVKEYTQQQKQKAAEEKQQAKKDRINKKYDEKISEAKKAEKLKELANKK